MLTVNQVAKRYGDILVLNNINLIVNPGDRIGLVGPNGSGKSTLLRIVTGEDLPDAGSISAAPGVRIGHLHQGFADQPNGTLATILDGSTSGLVSDQAELEQALAGYQDLDADLDAVATRHERALDAFESAGGYAAMASLGSLLDQFALGDIPYSTALSGLSGGQKTRAGLAALLASRPDLLVLDEPTNHLDIDALDWLQSFLLNYPGAVLLVSHDRGFLDAVVNEIVELDPETHSATVWSGNYSDYVAGKRHAEEEHAAAYHRQQKEIARITEDIRTAEGTARTIEASTIDYAIRAKAAKIARPAVVRKRKLERLLESTDYVEKPQRRWGLAVDIPAIETGGRDVAILEHANLGYGGDVILHDVSLHLRFGDRVALTGPNGGGKTTLIRTLIGQLPPVSGVVRLGTGIIAGYIAQEQDTLDPNLTVLQQARKAGDGSDSDLRTYLHRYLFAGDMVHRLIANLSYGERTRLMLALLTMRGTNFLLLDEPLNHLDVDARREFEDALLQFDGTVLIVLHDRFAIGRLASRLIEVRGGMVRELDPAVLTG